MKEVSWKHCECRLILIVYLRVIFITLLFVFSTEPLEEYNGATITLTLPGDTTVYDIEWISMFCILANQNFGDINIPQDPSFYVPPILPAAVPQVTRPGGGGGVRQVLLEPHRYMYIV